MALYVTIKADPWPLKPGADIKTGIIRPAYGPISLIRRYIRAIVDR
jgi:hypothetical protein